jgi:hypothetical protein
LKAGSQRDMYIVTSMFTSIIIHNKPNNKSKKVINKLYYIYIYIHTHTKEYYSVINICYKIDEFWRHYAKWNKPVTKILSFPLYLKIVKFTKTESRIIVTWEWAKGELFNGQRVTVLQDEKVLEMCCTAKWIYSTWLH